MSEQTVIKTLVEYLSKRFDDFAGLYFFGSRKDGLAQKLSDYDVILLFGVLDYDKRLEIAGIVSELEYSSDSEIDYKLFTQEGNTSIDYIRQNINPFFIREAVDNGIYYGRR